MLHDGHPLVITYKWARRIAIALVGFTVLCVGAAMLVLPGPGLLVMASGLGILAVEFAWARRWLTTARARGMVIVDGIRNRNGRGR